MAGIALATAMVFTAIALVVRTLEFSVGAGTLERTRVLAVVPLSQIALFAAFVAAAVVTARRPETHRRLMLLATANLLPAAVARLFGVVLAPPNARRPSFALVANENLAFTVGLIAALIVDLLIVVAIVRDWRTRRRPHPVYVIGGACMLIVQLLRTSFAYTHLWHRISDGLLALGPDTNASWNRSDLRMSGADLDNQDENHRCVVETSFNALRTRRYACAFVSVTERVDCDWTVIAQRVQHRGSD